MCTVSRLLGTRGWVDAGALEGLRIELLDGLLVDLSPQGEPHARASRR
jgi:hypothetical protein